MNELNQPFVRIGKLYYPTNAIYFEVNEFAVTVTVYKLGPRGTSEQLGWYDGPQAHIIIGRLGNMSTVLLVD